MKYLVTGSSSGLGFQLCRKLLRHGDVIGLSRSLGKCELLIQETNFSHISCDLSDPSLFDLESCFRQELLDRLGNQDFTLILNAAFFYQGSQRLSSLKLDQIFHVNVLSAFKLVDLAQTLCLKRVLFVNSVSGLIGQQAQHEYVSTKHALMGFSKSLAKSAKLSDFDVMSINPGGMKTELWDQYSHVSSNDFLSPSLIADLCVTFLLIQGRTFIENFTILPASDV